jgi:neutral trehalase
MFEKYDVVTRASKTRIRVGYKENVIGFGWTNGVFLELLHQLPADLADKLGRHRAAKQ